MIELINDFTVYTEKDNLQLSNSVAQVQQIFFRNSGDVTVRINSTFRLEPNQTLSISQDVGCCDRTDYNIQFFPNDPASTGTFQHLDVVSSIYK